SVPEPGRLARRSAATLPELPLGVATSKTPAVLPADDLRRFLSGQATRARPLPVWQRGWKGLLRRPRLALAVSAGLLALVEVPAPRRIPRRTAMTPTVRSPASPAPAPARRPTRTATTCRIGSRPQTSAEPRMDSRLLSPPAMPTTTPASAPTVL